MGFDLFGRSLFRLALNRPDVEVAAVADSADADMLRYLLKFSTLPGRFEHDVTLEDGRLVVNGQRARVVQADGAGDAPWSDLGVDTVVDFRDSAPERDELEAHLEGGARRVLACGTPADGFDRSVVVGLNDGEVAAGEQIVQVGSQAAHCAGPLLAVLDQAFGVEQAFVSAVRSYRADSRLADVPAPELRRGRAAGENIIPASAETAAELEGALPSLRGRVSASAMDVPVANGSVVDLVCWHRDAVTVEALNGAVAAAAEGSWSGRMRCEREAIVSADTVGSQASSIFDSQATMTLGDHVSKTLAWFDSGWAHIHRIVELAAALDRPAAAGDAS